MILLIGVALAIEPPTMPVPAEPVAAECVESYGLNEGDVLPEGLIDGQVAACSAVAVPTSHLATLLGIRTYNISLQDRYRLDTAALEANVAFLTVEIDQLNEQAPFFQQPRTQRWIGIIEGTVIGVAVVMVWGASSE